MNNVADQQQEKKQAIVDKAVEGYTQSHLDATPEQIETFRKEVSNRVMERPGSDSASVRAARRKAVNDLAEKNGVKFVHIRHSTPVLMGSPNDYIEFDSEGELEFVGKPEVRELIDLFGGATVAYRFHVTLNGDLTIQFSIAICRDDEPFDRLIGEEQAINRFLNENAPARSVNISGLVAKHLFSGKGNTRILDEIARLVWEIRETGLGKKQAV